ncbi:MAG: hypothetical protein WCF19_00680 [Chlamydiales bacterium]
MFEASIANAWAILVPPLHNQWEFHCLPVCIMSMRIFTVGIRPEMIG